MSDMFSPPERLIPQGWIPRGWSQTDHPTEAVPAGVNYFTPETALQVAALCPDFFPQIKDFGEQDALTAFFALTILASTNNMAVVRLMSNLKIVAVGIIWTKSSLIAGRRPAFDAVFDSSDEISEKLKHLEYVLETYLHNLSHELSKE